MGLGRKFAIIMGVALVIALPTHVHAQTQGTEGQQTPIIREQPTRRLFDNRFPSRDRSQRHYYSPSPIQIFPPPSQTIPMPQQPDQVQESCRDRAKAAVQSGQAKPFPLIKRDVESQFEGRVVDLRCASFGPGLVYEVKLVRFDGRVTWVTVDARDGRVVGVR